MTETEIAYAPETIEGWYALHQIFRLKNVPESSDDGMLGISAERRDLYPDGWTGLVKLIGSRGHVMGVHFYPTLERIAEAQTDFAKRLSSADPSFELVYSFLSVTEAGLYHLTARLASDAKMRGGSVGDDVYRAELAKRVRAETESDFIRRRLFPQPPADMPYVSFYPMSKRRQPGQNWYTLSLDERSRLMQEHGLTGRRYAGRVQQVITGAVGFDAWEWGVTLFGKDPLDFKKLVTEMRFDEASSKYADFGEFFVGKLIAVL
jgi:hydrogen peroxide-dependent heme synthase